MTGYGMPDDKQRAKEAGFAHHVTKPPRLAELISSCRYAGPAAPEPAASVGRGARSRGPSHPRPAPSRRRPRSAARASSPATAEPLDAVPNLSRRPGSIRPAVTAPSATAAATREHAGHRNGVEHRPFLGEDGLVLRRVEPRRSPARPAPPRRRIHLVPADDPSAQRHVVTAEHVARSTGCRQPPRSAGMRRTSAAPHEARRLRREDEQSGTHVAASRARDRAAASAQRHDGEQQRHDERCRSGQRYRTDRRSA